MSLPSAGSAPPSTALVRPKISIGSSKSGPFRAIEGDDEAKLMDVLVDQHQRLPDMFEVLFEDESATILETAGLTIGKWVKVEATNSDGANEKVLIVGEITALEGEFIDSGFRLVVRGYEMAHRLHRGRTSKSWSDTKDSDIAKEIAGKHKLGTSGVKTSPITHKYIGQVNLTDWEFLTARADEIGFEVFVRENDLHFEPIDPSAAGGLGGALGSVAGAVAGALGLGGTPALAYRTNLLWLRPRVNSGEQVGEVEVRYWDPATKAVVTETAPVKPFRMKPKKAASMSGSWKAGKSVVFDRPFSTSAEATSLAKSLALNIGDSYFTLEGMATGDPAITAGGKVEIKEVPDPFAGTYVVTNARHTFSFEEGYNTHFFVSGSNDMTLTGLTGGSSTTFAGVGQPIYGMATAEVTDNEDPEKLGRVKLKLGWLDAKYETDWCRVSQFGAGKDRGMVFLPEVKDEVLVAFEFGDVRRPYVVGGLYNGKDKPQLLGTDALFKTGGKVIRRGIVSSLGHTLMFLDDSQKSGVQLTSADKKLQILMDETNKQIHIKADQGTKIMIETAANGDLTIKSGAKMIIESQQELSLKGMGVTIDGGASGVKIESSGTVAVMGSMIKLN